MSIQLENVLPENFSGVVPLFPLPNLVMFPGVVQPLQIFEHRYRAMMEWTLNHEKLIAMTVLESGELAHLDKAPIKPVVCIGRIVAHTQTDDGRYKLLLIGGKRARIENELSAPQPFRTAQVSLLEDLQNCDPDDPETEDRFARLASAFLQYLRETNNEGDEFRRLIENEMTLGLLTDIVSSTLELPSIAKYSLLKNNDAMQRADQLIGEFKRMKKFADPFAADFIENGPVQTNSIETDRGNLRFPPPFSRN